MNYKMHCQKFPGIRLQEDAAQWRFKLSYYVDDNFDEDDIANLYKFFDDHKAECKNFAHRK